MPGDGGVNNTLYYTQVLFRSLRRTGYATLCNRESGITETMIIYR